MAKKSDALRQFLTTLGKSDKPTVMSSVSTILRKYQTPKENPPKKSDIIKLKAALTRLETFRCSPAEQKIVGAAVTTITYIQLLLLEKASGLEHLEKMRESLKLQDESVQALIDKNKSYQIQTDQLAHVVADLKESRRLLSKAAETIHSIPAALNDLQRDTSSEFAQFKELILNFDNKQALLADRKTNTLVRGTIFLQRTILFFLILLLCLMWWFESNNKETITDISNNLVSKIDQNHSESQKSIKRISAETGSWTKEKQDQWASFISQGESNNKRTLEIGLLLENFTKTLAEYQKNDPNMNQNNTIFRRKHALMVVHFHTDSSELTLENLAEYRVVFSKETSSRLAGSKPAGLFAVVGNRVNPLVFLKGTNIPDGAWVLPDLPPKTIPSKISTVFQSLEEYSSDINSGEKDLLLIVSPEVEVPEKNLLINFGKTSVIYCSQVGAVITPEAEVSNKIKWLEIAGKKQGAFFQFFGTQKRNEKEKTGFFQDLIRNVINGF